MIKNQQGFIPVGILVGAFFVATVFGSGIFLSKTHFSTENIATITNENEFSEIKDPLLRKHFTAQANSLQYFVKTVSLGKQGFSQLEAQTSGNTTNYRFLENDGTKDTTETISLFNTFYIKDYSDNSWWKQKIQEETEDVNQKPENFKTEFLTKQEKVIYENNGKEICGKSTCYIYQEINPKDPESKRVFLFDDKKFLLQKEELSFGEFKTTNIYSYNEVFIKEPFPSKNVPEGKSIFEYSPRGNTLKPSASDAKKVQNDLKSYGDYEILDLQETF